MNEDDAEALVSTFLASYGLRAERFSQAERRRGKTPDFRVVGDGQVRFFTEVKSVRGGDWLDQQLKEAEPGTIVGGARPDPVFNRLAKDVHEAVKQFDAVNAARQCPNVLALVSFDDISDVRDLLGVITGNFYADGGSKHAIYQKYSEGRMKADRLKIDLYLWFGPDDEHHFLFTPVHQSHHLSLCSSFGKDPTSIKAVDA